MSDRIPLDELNSDQYDALCERAEQAEAAIERVRALARRWHAREQPSSLYAADVRAVLGEQPGPAEADTPALRKVIFETMREAYIERCLLDRTTPKQQIETLTDAVIAAILPMTRTTAALARMSETDVQRVIDVTEEGPPSDSGDHEWDCGWNTAMDTVRNALMPKEQ